jgi:hypothetical protein
MQRAQDGAALAVVPQFAHRRCVRCDELLGDSYWITNYPHGAHERCVDWNNRAFPFERQANALVRIARAPEVTRPDLLHRAARALWALKSRWPHNALGVLDHGRIIITAARRYTADAPAKLRELL